MNRVRRSLRVSAAFGALVALASASVVLLAAAPASACSCVGLDDAQAFEDADAVFVGTLEARGEPSGESSGSPVTLTFEVTRGYKGDVERQQEIVTAESGASCGLDLEGKGPFLVYARENSMVIGTNPGQAPDGTLFAGLCNGTRSISAAAGVPTSFGAGAEPRPSPSSTTTTPSTSGPKEGSGDSVGSLTSGFVGLVVFAVGGAAIGILYGRRKRRSEAGDQASST